MTITSRLDFRHIVIIIFLLVVLYWLLLPAGNSSLETSKVKLSQQHPKSEAKVKVPEDYSKERDTRENLVKIKQLTEANKKLNKQLDESEKYKMVLEAQLKKNNETFETRAKSFDSVEERIKEISAASDTISSENKRLKKELAGKEEVKPTPFKGLKIVHLDLKGAPPKIDYLIKFFKLSKQYGADGFLMEYEDMFPWKGNLSILARKNAYSEKDIKLIVDTAKKENMILIPLVQTFGHLEYILKHKSFAHLRANKEISNSVSALHNESVPFVKKLLKQVMALHPNSKYVHLGGDEVWNIKTCKKCLSSKMSVADLYTHHMMPLLKHVNSLKNQDGKKLKPMIWDDMMRKWEVDEMKKMANLVLPMVWAYVANLDDYSHFPSDMWDKYVKAFPEIWIASSFKGALKPWSEFVPVKQHLENHLSWLKITAKLQKKNLKVAGIALTGWSRFDHYGPLCEILPSAIPSLSLCLSVLQDGTYNKSIHESVSKMLGFKSPFKIGVTNFKGYTPESATFPGADVYKLVGQLEKAIGWKDWSMVREIGWTRSFHVRKGFLSYFALNVTLQGLNTSMSLLRETKGEARDILEAYFDEDMIHEWIIDKISYYIEKAKTTYKSVERIMKSNTFV